MALATYATLTIHASAGTLDATAPLDVHLTDAPGAADITFAITGKKAYGFKAASAEMADVVAIAPDGKIVVAGRDSTANGFVLVRLLENGDLDPDFGSGGVVAIPDGGVSLQTGGVVVRADGSILLAVVTGSSGIVYAFDNKGDLDMTWNGSGAVVLNAATINMAFQPAGLALTSDGHVIVGGSSNDFVAIRLDAQGQLDPSFDGDGIATIDLGGIERATDFAQRPDGRLVISGLSTTAHNNYALAQLTASGAPDASFSGDGKLVLDVGVNTGFQAHTLLADGRIAASGIQGLVKTVTMIKPDGELDLGFDSDGFLTTSNMIYALTDVDDGLLLTGNGAAGKAIQVTKTGMDGAFDNAFGDMGISTLDVTGESTWMFGAALDAQGRLVTVGWAGQGSELAQFVVARFWK